MKSAESRLGWPVISVVWVGDWISECGCKQLFFLPFCTTCFLFHGSCWLYVAYLVIRRMHLLSWCVRQNGTFGAFRLMLAWYYVTGQEFFSSLCSLQGHRAFITESKNCFSHVSMDTIIDSSKEFDTCVVYLYTFPAYLSPLPTRFLVFSSNQLYSTWGFELSG